MREGGGESGEHAVGGFADGQYPQVDKLAKVEGVTSAAQRVARMRKAALDREARVNCFEGTEKNFAGEGFAVHGGRLWKYRRKGRQRRERNVAVLSIDSESRSLSVR